ncbi:helix-turn-helix transcriptional regulator, partial [Nocardia sp. NPDC004722]
MVRAAGFTPDPDRRGARLARAAEWAAESGRSERALRLALTAETLPLDPGSRARIGAARALMAFDACALGRARALWMRAGQEVTETDSERAAIMLVSAARAAFMQGDLPAVRVAREQLARLDLPDAVRTPLLGALDGPLSMAGGDLAAGIGMIRETVEFSRSMGMDVPSVPLNLAGQALLIGDAADARDIMAGLMEEIRARGMVGWVPATAAYLGNAELVLGRLCEAATALAEGLRIARDVDQPTWVDYAEAALAVLAAMRGDERTCRALAVHGLSSGEDSFVNITHTEWALGLLDLGLGNYEAALDRLEALYRIEDRVRGHWVHLLRDLVEAAVRLRRPERAAAAMAEIERWAAALGSPFAEAIALRGRAALHGDGEAYEQALKLQAAEGLWYDYARTALLYGEWLRRERRRADARVHLRRAAEIFDGMSATLWADRARTELRAAGESMDPAPAADLAATLTPQELQVVRLAAAGATNKEIAARLFLSPKTIGHHLYRAFPKLGVSSRMELARLGLDRPVNEP